MTKNMGTTDRVIRVLIAIFVGVLYFTGQIGGTLAAVLGVLSLIFVLTSLIGICPLYGPFHINTRGTA
jgi:hypothetical protein